MLYVIINVLSMYPSLHGLNVRWRVMSLCVRFMFSCVRLSLDLCARAYAYSLEGTASTDPCGTRLTTGDRFGWRLLPWQMDGLCTSINVGLKPTERPDLDSKGVRMLWSTALNEADVSSNDRPASCMAWMNVCFHAGLPNSFYILLC